MKNVFITLTLIFLTILITPSNSFAQSGGFLIIRVMESSDKGYAKIIVTENGKQVEVVDLEKHYYKNLEANQIVINNVLDNYATKEYKLKDMTSGGAGEGIYSFFWVTTYLFEKE